MGYAAEKKKAEGKWRRFKIILFAVCLCLVLALAIVAIVIPPSSWKYRVSLPDIDERKTGEMRIHFLDVGQGDATIVELPDGKIALIDGGTANEHSEKALMRYLYALKIDTVHYLFLTHADEDHCGGLDTVLKYMQVERAYIPLASATVNTEYGQFYAQLIKEEGCEISELKNDTQIVGDGYVLACLYPSVYDVETAKASGTTFDENTNDYSAVLWLEYEGVSTLLMGDLPADKESVLIEGSEAGIVRADLMGTDVLHVGHHGSKNATSAVFLSFIQAEVAVISCGENEYGHPSEETLSRLQAAGVATYRTDTQGSIVVRVQTGGSYSVANLGNS